MVIGIWGVPRSIKLESRVKTKTGYDGIKLGKIRSNIVQIGAKTGCDPASQVKIHEKVSNPI